MHNMQYLSREFELISFVFKNFKIKAFNFGRI